MHYMISFFQEANYTTVPFHNTKFKARYMQMQKKPITCILKKVEEGLFGLDGSMTRFYPINMILMQMGKIIECMLIQDVDEFNNIFRGSPDIRMEEEFHRINMVNGEIALRS